MLLGLRRLSIPGGGLPPFYPDATLALDFVNGAYRVGAGGSSRPDFASLPNLTVTRATPAVSWDTTGTYSFAANVPRIVPGSGLLVEEARTSLFLNSFAPATQNVTITAVSHTITVWGSGSVTVAAGTATISNAGAASAGSPRTIGCTVGGTISVTVTGSPSIVQVEAGAFGTSPIPTAGASVIRAADGVNIGGITGPSPVSWVAEWLASSASTARVAAYTSSGGAFASPQSLVTTQGGASSMSFGGSGSGVTATISAATPGVTVIKLAGMANASGTVQRASSQGGAAVGNTAGDYTGVGTAKIQLGALDGSATQPLNSYLRRLVIYPRAFSDAELVAAST